MGKVSLPQLVEERGYDYVEFLTSYAEGLKQADEAMGGLGDGVMFDGDPRKSLKPTDAEKATAKTETPDAVAA